MKTCTLKAVIQQVIIGCFLLTVIGAQAQQTQHAIWDENAGGIFLATDGNRVGIGVDNPAATLEVDGSIRSQQFEHSFREGELLKMVLVDSTGTIRTAEFPASLVPYLSMDPITSAGNGNDYLDAVLPRVEATIDAVTDPGENCLSIGNSFPNLNQHGAWKPGIGGVVFLCRREKAGIGTNNPQSPLHVYGTITLSDKEDFGNSPGGIKFKDGSFQETAFTPENGVAGWFSTGANQTYTNNNVGIGLQNPEHPLDIAGTARACAVIVEPSQWCDYVFEEDYKLRSLDNLSNYIKTNKHLPEIPKTEQVLEEGIDVGEMNALLLKKVEELTLYVLQLNEEIEKMKK